jgi:nitroreductase
MDTMVVEEGMTMPLMDWLKRVCYVSDFDDKEISDELLNTIASAAMPAPSTADVQPWEIIAVRSKEQKQGIANAMLDSHLRPNTGGEKRRHWLVDTPLVLVVCLDHIRAKVRFGERGERVFGIQDTGFAIQNIRLVALENGVKSCLLREFDPDKVAQLLELPGHVEPLILIPMGFSSIEPKEMPHLELEDYLHHEKW